MIRFEEIKTRKTPIAVVGLGYVGLPLAVSLSRHFEVIGFDISEKRIAELRSGRDNTGEVEDADLKASGMAFSTDPAELSKAGVIIVAVPTPIDEHRNPDLRPIVGASNTVGGSLAKGSIVVFESTVYPGLTEEICVPILEEKSGLKCGEDFTVGYSPERINPGDKVHTLETIVKVVAGQDAPTLDLLAELYATVVKAGVHKASSIKEAEAAKVIENTQRDLNIALMNELAIIFDKLGIDTKKVLEAAGTKWNFLPFSPGLVGGHCIGVDPYYLTYKAEAVGYHPQVILSGRRINDNMGRFIVEKAMKMVIKAGMNTSRMRVGILGLTFKEDCPDLRNTKVVDIYEEFLSYGSEVLVHDPLADPGEAEDYYGIKLQNLDDLKDLGVLVLAVAHREYREMSLDTLISRIAPQGCLIDVKAVCDLAEIKASGVRFWRL